MFEQSFENEERSIQQRRRPASAYADRRGFSRGDEDRFENQDRMRYHSDSERRYTRPDYDSELDIQRPGQAHFGSRGGSDYGREYDQERAWQRPYAVHRLQERDGYDRQNRFESGRGIADWGRSMSGSGSGHYKRSMPDRSGDWYSTGAGMGHADWNHFGSDERTQSWGRRFSDQGQQPVPLEEQRSRWPKSYKRSDERIKDDIHEELIRHSSMDASDIEVQVKGGEVTLSGQVALRRDKRLAEELAENVLGVRDVQNQLRVRSPSSGQSSDQSTGSSGSVSAQGTRSE